MDMVQGDEGIDRDPDTQNVNNDLNTTSDLKRCKNILEMTNAHFVGYEPGGDIQISSGPKFVKIISKFFPQSKQRSIELV
jgi:hypothetical protein